MPAGRGAAATAGRLRRAAPLIGWTAWALDALIMGTAGRGWSLDLRVYLAAGAAFRSGHPVYTALFTEHHLPFSYPPLALLVLSPLSVLPIPAAEVTWWIVDAVALTATVWIALRQFPSLASRDRFGIALAIAGVSALVLEPVRSNIDYGQINVLLMLMVVADLLEVRGRWRGALTGVAAAVKLTPLYFVLYFLVARQRRAAVTTAATFVGLSGLAWALLPADSQRYFLHEVFQPGRFGGADAVSNQAWSGIFHRAPFTSATAATPLWLMACAAVTVVTVLLARRVIDKSRLQAVVVVAIGSLLVSPLSWSHHWCWLVLLPLVAWELRARRVLLGLCVSIMAVAVVAPYFDFRHGVSRPIASSLLVLLSSALLVAWLASEARTDRRAVEPSPAGMPLP